MNVKPTEEDIYRQEFNAIWQAIKDWNIGRPSEENKGEQLYSHATGTDVMTILNALRSIEPVQEQHNKTNLNKLIKDFQETSKDADYKIWVFKGCHPRLGSYHIGSTKVFMFGPIRVFVGKN